MSQDADYREVAHCGGLFYYEIECDANGQRLYAVGCRHDRPSPAGFIGLWALAPHGIPVANMYLGGLGAGSEPGETPEDCYQVLLGSDRESCWGHQCPNCKGGFRSENCPIPFPITCPYCGVRANAFQFRTLAQRTYIAHCVSVLLAALEAPMEPGTSATVAIDIDLINDEMEEHPTPEYYYGSESQQTQFSCSRCGEFNDIYGVYSYCAACGCRNNAQILSQKFSDLRERTNDRSLSAKQAVQSAVSEFDAVCRDLSRQIRKRIPMKPARRADLEQLIFHNLDQAFVERLKSMFDIDLWRGMERQRAFVKMMLHRRHIYEHNAGVADERYVRESGDNEAREGALIRESQENVHSLLSALMRMAENFDKDFHEIFAPTIWPINRYNERRARN